MKINKQLFEDVLAGKLKGTFLLRNYRSYNSDNLTKNNREDKVTYPYCIGIWSYKPTGYFCNCISDFDIVDFIPETNMKENELTIEIPNGKIVDWEESKKQNKIVLKDKQLTYEDVCNKLPGMIDISLFDTPSKEGNALVANEHQLECLLAKNKLANVAVYLNDGWKPSGYIFGCFICTCGEELEIRDRNDYKFNNNIIFKSKKIALQAIEILGEETIKLALELLGV